METEAPSPREASPSAARRGPSYLAVFLILAVITAVELGVKGLGLPRAATNGLFLALSLAKAALVAAFYMHLRRDHRIYAIVFILPVILFVTFALLTIVI
jgi:cytochrome c oxidase subunit 4